MRRDELVQKIIDIYRTHHRFSMDEAYIEIEGEDAYMDNNESHLLLDYMLAHELITGIGNGFYRITNHGKWVHQNGGWIVRKNQLEADEEKKRKREEANYEKLLLETRLAKWQVKIFWPSFIFLLIGSCLGIASFLMQLNSESKFMKSRELP